MLKLYDLKTEYRRNPIGLNEPQPAFSWKLKSDKKGVYQDSCRISVFEGEACVWDRGWLKTEQSLYHVYAGRALRPRAGCASPKKRESCSDSLFFGTSA